MSNDMNFGTLVSQVQYVHDVTSSYAKGAVNQLLTIRNWAIGYYIVEFEQNGQDRADYGSRLLENLATRINCKGLDNTMLNLCRSFYLKYPQICDSVSRRLKGIGAVGIPLKLQDGIDSNVKTKIFDSVNQKFKTDPELLITKLSFTHLRYILPIDDPFERFFYELECIKGTWSVRELRRQIDTKLFFRAGISKKPELLLEKIDNSEEMTEGDNPPVGILLCTEKGEKMVQYVLNGMDENLFASKYMLQLPDKAQLETFLINEMKEMGL